MRVAVLDMGTNTFHLLIAEKHDKQFSIIYKERKFVRILKESVNEIVETAQQRAFEALEHFKNMCDLHEVVYKKAIATEAFRKAKNGRTFLDTIQHQYDFETHLVSGDEEAELIYQGVKKCVPLTDKAELIMDIGGGSVEFIVCNSNTLFWKKSFPIGVSVLRNLFAHNNPIQEEEVEEITTFFDRNLSELFPIFNTYKFNRIIGTAGSFDAIAKSIDASDDHAEITLYNFQAFYETMLNTSLQERILLPAIGKDRAELMVLAILLIHWVMQHSKAVTIRHSTYALKEGALFKYFEQL